MCLMVLAVNFGEVFPWDRRSIHGRGERLESGPTEFAALAPARLLRRWIVAESQPPLYPSSSRTTSGTGSVELAVKLEAQARGVFLSRK
jgi:hypothetical protein